MTPLLILLGLSALFLASDKRRRGPSSPEIPIGPGAEHFESIGGRLAYKRSVARSLIQALLYRAATPSAEPNVMILYPTTGAAVGPDAWGAYYGFEALHDQGFALWVPLHFHWPQSQQAAQFVLYLPPDEPPPDDYALLIAPEELWPALGR